MKSICECCKKRVATMEDTLPFDSKRGLLTGHINVCRKCYDAAQKTGMIKREFYAHAREMSFV